MNAADTAEARRLLERGFRWGLAYEGPRHIQEVLAAVCDLAAGVQGADERLREAVCGLGPETRAWLREHGNPDPEPTVLRFLDDCRKTAAIIAAR